MAGEMAGADPGVQAGATSGIPAAGIASVEVPATSANLGPGFDALGLALDLSDRIVGRFTDGEEVVVEVVGEGAGVLPDDGRNLVATVVRTGLATFDPSGELAHRGLWLECSNDIPQGRGLGSSAAAIVGGLALAAQLAGVADQVSAAELVALASRLEGHPDNVAPSVLGGATIAWMAPGPMGPVGRAVRFEVHPDVVPVLAIPAGQAATSTARGALPQSVSHADAAFNAGRAALLVHALSRDPRLLLEATDDRLHQEQRRAVYPASMDVVTDLRAHGIAAAISGAGPSVIALAGDGTSERVAARIADVVGDSMRIVRLGVAQVGVHAG